MLGLLVLSSHNGTCGGRRSLLFRGDVSPAALDVMRRHTHTPVLIEGRPTSEILALCIARRRGGCTLDPYVLMLFEHPSSRRLLSPHIVSDSTSQSEGVTF